VPARSGHCRDRVLYRRDGRHAAHCACRPPIAEIALKFGAPEYFFSDDMGLIASAVLAHGSMVRRLA